MDNWTTIYFLLQVEIQDDVGEGEDGWRRPAVKWTQGNHSLGTSKVISSLMEKIPVLMILWIVGENGQMGERWRVVR